MKKILMFCCFCMMLFGLTGCVDRTTTVMLNEDFSGNRLMELSVSRSIAESYLLVDFDTLKSVTMDNCPEELGCSIEAGDSGYRITFDLQFQNIEDYKEKLSSLAGRNVEIEVHVVDTPFSSGISVTEDCETKELLQWFPQALVANGCIKEENASYILDDSNNTVITSLVYGEEEYFSWTKDQVNIEEIDYVALNGVYFYTEIDGEKLKRTIVVDIPNLSVEKRGEEIETFLTAHVPENATSRVMNGDNDNQLFTIEIPFCSVEEMEEAMKHFCESSQVSIAEETKEADSLYGVAGCMKERCDLTLYISDNPNCVNSAYFVKENDDLIVSNVALFEEGESEYNPLMYDNSMRQYSLLGQGRQLTYDIQYDYEQLYHPVSAMISTEVAEDGLVHQMFEIHFDDSISNHIKETFLSNALKRMPNSMEVEWEEEGKLIYSISGTAKELNDVVGSIIPGYEISFGMENSFIKPMNQYSFSCDFSIESVFPDQSGEVTYVFRLPGKIKKTVNKNESLKKEGNQNGDQEYQLSGASSFVSIEVKGTVTNTVGIIILAVIVLIVVICIVIVILSCKKRKSKKQLLLQNAMPVAVQETVQLNSEMVSQDVPEVKSVESTLMTQKSQDNEEAQSEIPHIAKQYCVRCGSEIVANAAFCEECGMSIKDSFEGGNN